MPRIRKKTQNLPRNTKAKKQKEAESVEILNENQTEATESVESAESEPLIKENEEVDTAEIALSNLTLAELAELARPYSNRSETTLQRLKREELIYIITNKRDDYAKTELSNLNRDSKDLLEIIISILEDIKQARGGGNLNALLVRIFRNQGNRISEGFIKIGVSGGVFGWVMCGIVSSLLIVDSVFGLQSISKIFKKKEQKGNEAKPN